MVCYWEFVFFFIMWQYDWCSWIPNSPSTMRKPTPTKKGEADVKYIMESLPDRGRSCWHLGAVWALSQFQDNEVTVKQENKSFISILNMYYASRPTVIMYFWRHTVIDRHGSQYIFFPEECIKKSIKSNNQTLTDCGGILGNVSFIITLLLQCRSSFTFWWQKLKPKYERHIL